MSQVWSNDSSPPATSHWNVNARLFRSQAVPRDAQGSDDDETIGEKSNSHTRYTLVGCMQAA
jgi:hypothetical protein